MFFKKKDKEKIMIGFNNLSKGFAELSKKVDDNQQISLSKMIELAKAINKTFTLVATDMGRVEDRVKILEDKKSKIRKVKKVIKNAKK